MEHHLKYILVKELIPLARVLKDDKVTNVRCLLRKCLRSMPKDIRGLSDVAKALKVLDMEEELWEDVSLIRQSQIGKRQRNHTRTQTKVIAETEHRIVKQAEQFEVVKQPSNLATFSILIIASFLFERLS
jgi:hypothetical protein